LLVARCEGRKPFFFEKKKQKTFITCWSAALFHPEQYEALMQATVAKVFWSFFSKKDCFLPKSLAEQACIT
jgi:hypothetical protein